MMNATIPANGEAMSDGYTVEQHIKDLRACGVFPAVMHGGLYLAFREDGQPTDWEAYAEVRKRALEAGINYRDVAQYLQHSQVMS